MTKKRKVAKRIYTTKSVTKIEQDLLSNNNHHDDRTINFDVQEGTARSLVVFLQMLAKVHKKCFVGRFFETLQLSTTYLLSSP